MIAPQTSWMNAQQVHSDAAWSELAARHDYSASRGSGLGAGGTHFDAPARRSGTASD
jgi:hypothetical protein